MVTKISEYPKVSDWSIPEEEEPQNSEITDVNPYHAIHLQTKELQPLPNPVKCPTWMSPCLKGLLLGVFLNGLTLAIVLTVWFIPHEKTGVIITNEIPPGTILLYSGNLSSLIGSTHRWLLCDGSEVSRSNYSDLFKVIGTTYGLGNGNDTFNLPNFRARFPMGSDSRNDTQFAAGGAASHMLTLPEMPAHTHAPGTLELLYNGAHTHSYSDPGHNHGGVTGSASMSGGSYSMVSGGGSGNDNGAHAHSIPTGTTGITIQSNGNHTHVLQGLTSSQGSNQSFSIIPPYQTIHYIIRA